METVTKINNMKTKDRWKARKVGRTYCAPACGRGCTHAEFKRAHRLADALIRKCENAVGGKWEKRVHENLGWHYSVSLIGGNLCINEYRDMTKPYAIGFSGGTPSQVFFRAHSKSIKWLVANQLRIIKEESKIWNTHVDKNNKALK